MEMDEDTTGAPTRETITTFGSDTQERETTLFQNLERNDGVNTLTQHSSSALTDDADQDSLSLTDRQNLFEANNIGSRQSEARRSALVRKPVMSQSLMEDISQVRKCIVEAKFNSALQFCSDKLIKQSQLTHDEVILFNTCNIYCHFKLKEYQNALTNSQELMKQIQSQAMLSLDQDDKTFPVLFMQAASLYEIKNVNQSLTILYKMLKRVNKKLSKSNKSGINGLKKAQTDYIKALDESQNSNDFLNDQFSNDKHDESAKKQEALCRQNEELFGLFPRASDYQAKYIMLSHEICRIHSKQQDYRNAYKVMHNCVKLFPRNPFVLSKMGRLCLEVGCRTEAQDNFSVIQKMLKENPSTQKTLDSNSQVNDILDGLLSNQPSDSLESEQQQTLEMIINLNRAFVNIFDGNYTDAISFFRKVMTYVPSNIVAANNIATCQIFTNQVTKSIEVLQEMIKIDPKRNINEQVVQNIMSLYEIQYPNNEACRNYQNILVEYCSTNSKDSVNASIFVQNKK